MENERQSRVADRPAGPRVRAREQKRQRRRRRLMACAAALALLVLAAAGVGAAWGGFRAQGSAVPASSEPSPPAPTAAVPTPSPTPVPTASPLTEEEKLALMEEDPLYPREMLEFARKYPQVIDYVFDYPEKKDQTWEVDLSAEAAGDQVPLLLQWDERWGYLPYGSGLIGYTGCGPVSLSMVALYLTGDSRWTPAAVARFAAENGYCVPGNGTAWTLISEGAKQLGLLSQELPLSERTMKDHLDRGHPIILVVGPGDFTYSGHYLVVTGYDEEGFRVNDPNSPENSGKAWTYKQLSPQIRNLWALWVDTEA